MQKNIEKQKKIKKSSKEIKPKVEPTESELVHRYVKQVIDKTKTRGYDNRDIAYIKNENTINKDLALDTEFYFSVVFQSATQKYQFLDTLRKTLKLETEYTEDQKIQIINGLKLAKALNINVVEEKAADYPLPDLELRSFVLDDEEF